MQHLARGWCFSLDLVQAAEEDPQAGRGGLGAHDAASGARPAVMANHATAGRSGKGRAFCRRGRDDFRRTCGRVVSHLVGRDSGRVPRIKSGAGC